MTSTDVGVQEVRHAKAGQTSPWAILAALAVGFFITLLDLTIINIAIPDIVADFDAPLNQVLWAVNAYVLVLTVLLISAGRLGDLFGQRRLFILGIASFTLFSALCGMAQSPGQLIIARALQGVGAACLLPQTMAIVIQVFPAERRGAALGVWGAVAGLAAVAGPALGGFIVNDWGWRWIFYINVPIGLLAIGLSLALVPRLKHSGAQGIDGWGVLLSSLALLGLTFALMEGQRFAWAGWIWGLMAAALGLLMIFIWQQRGAQGHSPLIPFALFEDRNYPLMTLVVATVSLSILALMLLLSIFFQAVLGFSALDAGLAIAPASLMSMLLAPLMGRLADRWDARYLVLLGLILSAFGTLWAKQLMGAGLLGEGSDWLAFVWPMVVIGMGNGLTVSPMITLAMRGVQPALAGAAAGLTNTVRQLGAVTAVAAVAGLLQLLVAANVSHGQVRFVDNTMAAYAEALNQLMWLPIGAMMLGVLICLMAKKK